MKIEGIWCPDYGPSFTSDGSLKKTVNMFIENIGLNVSDSVHANVTDDTLERAADIFIYLNFCPKLLTWKRFLEDLLANSSLQTILKTLNRMVLQGCKMERTPKS